MADKTILYAKHLEANATMGDFDGWEMPLHYGSQHEEHYAVRNSAGMFDLSHMTIVDIEGMDAKVFLQNLLANDVARLTHRGKALHSCMLNDAGCVIDDLIIFYLDDNGYRLILNSANRENDLDWFDFQSEPYRTSITPRRDLAMIAVQGPLAKDAVSKILTIEQQADLQGMKPFFGRQLQGVFIATTGYTGEDGYEIWVPNEQVEALWEDLLAVGIRPCGLDARDSLRLEAGMNCYGQDMDTNVSPLTANMGRTIAWEPTDRDFIGRAALEEQVNIGVKEQLVGLVMEEKGVMHSGLTVQSGAGEPCGVVTSGNFSPTLGVSIALARVATSCSEKLQVVICGKIVTVKVVKPPFVHHGKKSY